MNQTAVEWFVEEMFKQGYFNDKPMTVANINYFANIANKMFEEQINNAHYEGSENYRRQYYNETFKSE
jgi:hypothetical protein